MFGRKKTEAGPTTAGGIDDTRSMQRTVFEPAPELEEIWQPTQQSTRKSAEQLLLEQGIIQEEQLVQARQVQHMEVPEGARWCPCGDEVPQEYRHTPKIHLFVGDDWHHWKQTSFRHRVLYPAAWGKFFPSSETWRPVYQSLREDGSDPGPFDWDNTRSRRNRARAAVACWAPLAPDMTPHAFRHSHKTLMEELGTPKPLMNDRMGHKDHSVSGRYSHPTDGMREQLMEGLFRSWEMALAQRRDMGVSSPVRLVEDLLETSARSDSRSTPDLRPRLQIGPRGRVA